MGLETLKWGFPEYRGLQSLNGLSNVIDCRRVREVSARLVVTDKLTKFIT
jgi:hypothetical protein